MRRITRQVTSLALFVVIPGAASVAPLLVIPAITAHFGAAGWASVAVGLSIGVAASVIADLGWGIVGPQRIARDPARRRVTFDLALASRLAAVGCLAPVVAAATLALVQDHAAAAVLLSLGVLAGSLSPSWFFTGLGRPGAILVCETLPRVVCSLLSAVVISLGGPLEVYGVGMILAALICAVAASRHPDVRLLPSRAAVRAIPETLRAQGVLLAGRGVTTIYKSLPVVLIGLVNPGAVAVFAALDRPLRMALTVLTAVPNRLQSWIGVDDRSVAARRSRRSLAANALLGVISGGAFALGMPVVARYLFSGVVAVEGAVAVLGGLLIAVICASRGVGLSLVAADRADDTTRASIAAAVVAILSIPLGAHLGGVEGAVAGLIAAEVVGIAVQVPYLVRSPGWLAARSTRVAA